MRAKISHFSIQAYIRENTKLLANTRHENDFAEKIRSALAGYDIHKNGV